MLKYLLIYAAFAAVSFLLAGALSHISLKHPPFPKRMTDSETKYRFCLGCALFVTMGISAAITVANGYVALAIFGFIAAVAGAGMVALCFVDKAELIGFFSKMTKSDGGSECKEPVGSNSSDGGCNCGEPVGWHADKTTERIAGDCENCRNVDAEKCGDDNCSDQNANGDETSLCDGDDGINVVKTATDDHKGVLNAPKDGCATYKTRIVAVICFVFFAVSLAVFSLFAVLSDSIYVFGTESETEEKNVVFETVEQADGALFLKANGGADIYAVFGYGANLVDNYLLAAAVDGECVFTVRCAVMDKGEWSGYYLLLGLTDEEGVCYLSSDEALSAREQARVEKMVALGAVVAVFGGMSGFFTVLTFRKLKSEQSRLA